jgi:deoxyribonuclease V
MILSVDVHYEDRAADTACVGSSNWTDASAALEFVERSESVPEPYEPGQFYKRELPHLLRAIERVRCSMEIEAVIIDGHVWLNDNSPGLGAHLHRALGEQIAVIGVAKSAFREGAAIRVLRGQSQQPLFVTAAGIDPPRAAELVRSMHGLHRIPTLLKRTDQLARRHEMPNPVKAIATV